MNRTILYNVRPLAGESGWVLIEDGKIVRVDADDAPTLENRENRPELINGGGCVALPGFIDVHVHGAVGHDTMNAAEEALLAMARFYASHGVTAFLPTTMTSSDEATFAALQNVAQHMGPVAGGATILGVHLEGPYINVKMKGAQEGSYIRLADPKAYEKWLDLDTIRQVTVAPEFPENRKFIEACIARGINVSIGHTAATYEEVQQAVILGARQATHTFNAMTGVHHRNPGTAGAVLTMDEIACELIADNIHVHPAIMKLIVRAKGANRVVLITDAIMGAGLADGQYELGGQPVFVRNGMATLADGTLAGSILTMDRALRNILAATGLPLAEAWPMTSANAASQLGLAHRKGQLAPSFDADIVLLDDANQVTLTMAGGRVVYRR